MFKSIGDIEACLVREVAVILGEEPAAIAADRPLAELGIDSLSFVELLVTIEKNFGLKLMESGLTKEDFRTLRSLAKRIVAGLK